LLKIVFENENALKYSPPTNNIFSVISYDFKDSNNAMNIITNVATSNVIYIFSNTVRTKSTTTKRINVTTIKKNAVTTNQKVKIKRKSTRDLVKYTSSSPIATTTTNK